jgi:DNA-binding response OmpR family regulator
MTARNEYEAESAVPVTPGLRLLLVHETPEPELTRALARHGHDVLAVGMAERPLRFLRVFSPDVIVVTGRTGAVACRDLRLAAPSVAIVAIVGGRDAEDRVTLLDAGADDCLGTPYRLEELKARIAAAWRRATPTAPAAASAGWSRRMAGAL